MTELSLTLERTINAPQDKLFDAWLDPEMLRKFMTPQQGMSVPHAANDPKKGGRFDIVMQAGDDKIPHAGTYREIDPHERIVFTWESPYSVDESIVTLTFQPADQGTLVTLHHVRFASEDARDSHNGGWTAILDALGRVMES